MALIDVTHVVKEYRTPKRHPGFFGAARTLFTRQYETKQAVADISFAVEAGELLGYIGPNGAGKSTTIKLLTGILVPTSGEVQVAGLVPLWFFPAWLRQVADLLPFQAQAFIPLSIYLGRIPPRDIPAALGIQAIWGVLLCALAWVVWQRAMRRVVVQGG